MKKILLLMMCCPVILSAQNGVTVSNLVVTSGTVTFNVSWKKANMPALWSDSVWVFVDYNKAGKMERLPVTSATATAGTVTKVQGNDEGVWVIGNARSAGSFSATVQLLTDITDVAGACAYASNYPPVGEYTPSSAKFSFTGTPPYDLVLTSAESGTYTYSVNAGHYKLYDGETLQSFTDKTGAPGTIVMKLETPPYAASARIWNFGNSTLIWSDRIRATPAQCKQVTTSDFYADHPEYMIRDCGGQPMYLYNAYCLAVCAQELCPSPWRWPTYADYATIGSVTTAQINNATLCPGGYFNFSWQPENTEWGSTPSGNGNGRAFVAFDPDGTMRMWTHGAPTAYMNVRCVL